MHVVFDLDGVLVDSQHVIKTAYKLAGTSCPDNILELEGSTWLEDRVGSVAIAHVIKDSKNSHYLNLIGDAPLLPPYHAAVRLKTELPDLRLGVLTHAPRGTVERLQMWHADWPFSFYFERMTTLDKMVYLGDLDGGGVYIDDQVRLVNLPTGWVLVKYDVGTMNAEDVYRIIRARLPEGV